MNALLPKSAILYFDGACEPTNPGGWGTYGWVLTDQADNEIAHGHGVACRPCEGSTNNRAEYSALGFALRWLADRNWSGRLTIKGDSRLVVCQLNGTWACNKEHLQKLRLRCFDLLNDIGGQWEAHWIPRERNDAADALSRKAYEEATGQAFPERRMVAR